MAKADRKRILLGAVVLVILAIVLPPFINVNRYRARIVAATSSALGRPVSIGAMSLTLLPQPGFTMENFVVGDDPAFSAEPILRADEVRATLRMTSLWRGKLEIAKLSLQYPSLNLVRDESGRLNLESLLAHASRTPAAPTTAKKPEARVRFPYIQADAGRINFKSGLEKKVFVLAETDFALWSESENEWRMRLEGKPLRTDTNVMDSGTLRAEGSFKRADNLRDTPLQVRFTVERGQLGQMTKLIYGRDRGWRGTAQMSGTASGTPANLQVVVDASVQDFRRYDIGHGEPIRLQAHCSGIFSSTQESLRDLKCEVPTGTGKILAKGEVHGSRGGAYDLTVVADQLPMNWIVALARHAKRDLPNDLSATGTLSAEVHAMKSESMPPTLVGSGKADRVALRSELLGRDLSLESITFAFPSDAPNRRMRTIRGAVAPLDAAPRMQFPVFSVPMGGAAPLSAGGWISRDAYNLSLQGDAELERLTQVARALGIGVPHFRATGPTRVAITIAGLWKGFAQPNATGTLDLRDARAELPGIAQPVRILSARANLAAAEIHMQNAALVIGDVALSGNATFPRSCREDLPCASKWTLQFDEIDPAKFNALLNPRLKKRPWYRFFGGGDREESVLARIEAIGTVTAKRLLLRTTAATRVSSDFSLRRGRLELTNLRADLMGGSHTGAWAADFTGDQPAYAGVGRVSRVNVAQLAVITKDPWATGTLAGSYKIKMTGWDTAQLVASASAEAQAELRDGALRHLALDKRGTPLRFTGFTLTLTYSDGRIHIPESKLLTQNGIYQVSGTATLNRDLELQMSSAGGNAYKVTGTLEKPFVVAMPAREAEASLKR